MMYGGANDEVMHGLYDPTDSVTNANLFMEQLMNMNEDTSAFLMHSLSLSQILLVTTKQEAEMFIRLSGNSCTIYHYARNAFTDSFIGYIA